jgi:acetylornithine deacetylase/succinyl-diaminopimelate desuccinylase-like protein
MLINRGIPTIAGYGLKGGGFHAVNEYAELESLEKPLEFLVRLALGNDK